MNKSLAYSFLSNPTAHGPAQMSHSKRTSYNNNMDKYELGFFNSLGRLSISKENSYSDDYPFNCANAKNNLPCWLRESNKLQKKVLPAHTRDRTKSLDVQAKNQIREKTGRNPISF